MAIVTHHILAQGSTYVHLMLDGTDAELTIGPGNYLKLDVQTARTLAAYLEEMADAMEGADTA